MGHKLGGVPGDLQSESNGVSEVDSVSDMAPACWLCVGWFRKGPMASVCLDARHFSPSLYATDAFKLLGAGAQRE